MKALLTFGLLLIAATTSAQIKFSDKTFDNGMLYPVAHFPSNTTVADSMNAIIQRNLTDAAVSDFCIGDYGYFQKGNHIEIHLICNCIDFEATEHRYLFFSLETGTLVSYTDLFDSKEKEDALKHINKLVQASNNASFSSDQYLTWSDMTVRLYKDGIQIHPKDGLIEEPVLIPWTELSTYLKYSFL